MTPVQHGEVGVVGGLPAEGAHGADAVHRLHELDDHRRDRRGPPLVHPARPPPVQPHQRVQRHERRHRDTAEPQVQPEQQRRDVDEGQDDRDQLLQALVEQFAQRLHVRGGPGDQPARGVALVEVDAQCLGVPEDPSPEVQQHVLADAGGGRDERVLERTRPQRTDQVAGADRDQRAVVVVPERRYGVVDGVRHQQRARLHGRLLEQQQEGGEGDAGLHRRQQRTQQGTGRARRAGQDVPVEGVVGRAGRVLGHRPALGLLPVRLGGGGRGHRSSPSPASPGSRCPSSPDIRRAYSASVRSSS